MDLLDLLRWLMNGTDWLALFVAGAIGYLAGFFVPAGWWSILTSMLVSYHLFLGWLVLSANKAGGPVITLDLPQIGFVPRSSRLHRDERDVNPLFQNNPSKPLISKERFLPAVCREFPPEDAQ